MPEIHIGLVELAAMIGGIILSYGAVQWQTTQNKKDIQKLADKCEKDIEKLALKHETLERDIVEKLSALLVAVAELKGQLRNNDRTKGK